MAYKNKNRKKLTLREYWRQRTFRRLAKLLRKKSKWQIKLTASELWRLAKKQKLLCPLSGRKLTAQNISIDHIIPKSKGGSQTIENLRFVVKEVNLGKFCMTDTEFIALCGDVVRHNP